jgi:hypothetical protein
MPATRSSRRSRRRAPQARKAARIRRAAKTGKRGAKSAERPLIRAIISRQAVPPVQVLYRICKPGWAVIVEKTPNAQGTRFVCPFCTVSHRVPGPVRGFRKLRRAQWVKLRRVEE